ncbi:MAG: phytoene desaturase family protein [Thermoflexibacter sp.]|jgi:phytoene desaturase|nr:phytoene desaturase family protein [Thermoflexibacter sp.]
MTAGIIGAGIGGISTAIRLRLLGFEVSVFEANPYWGGKLSEFDINGYRFDAGPSLFTMPHFVEELFTLAGKKPQDYFEYEQLEVITHYFYEDGTVIYAYSDPHKFAQEVEAKTGEKATKVLKFLAKSEEKYKLTGDIFLRRSLHTLDSFLNKETLWCVLNAYKLDAFRTMNQANEAIFDNPKIVQLFNRYATYNGSDPWQTPATLNIIPHLEFGIGAFFPKKGMFAITSSLVELAKDLGVRFVLEAKVEEIEIHNHQSKKRIKGIKVGEQSYEFDLVVSNMDIVNTYKKLLKKEKQPAKILEQPKSSSALIFYWGIKREFEQLDLHNIFFSQDYKAEFEHIFNQKSIYHDPTIYINISSKYKKEDAPPQCENWFTMINVPNNSGQDWDSLIAQARTNIIRKLNRMLGVDLAQYIEVEEVLEPRSIESKTSSSQGALYGNSSNNRYAAFLRHANFSSEIDGLYFCGGSVHPGGGIPLALSSAKIVGDLVQKKYT